MLSVHDPGLPVVGPLRRRFAEKVDVSGSSEGVHRQGPWPTLHPSGKELQYHDRELNFANTRSSTEFARGCGPCAVWRFLTPLCPPPWLPVAWPSISVSSQPVLLHGTMPPTEEFSKI